MSRSFIISIVLCAVAGQYALAQTNGSQAPGPYGPDTPDGSHASTDLRVSGPNPGGWLFPITNLNESLPAWIQFGGQFRNRVESQDGFHFAATDDVYDLTQLRVGLYLQPTGWFKVVGVTQDSRVFFNHHVPNASPYQNLWDVREAYAQFGGSTRGWVDFAVGRQILSFGDERVIGPSDWSNMGRTFDALKLDLHHAGVKVSIFAASVIIARDGVIDHHLAGNNLYGIYSGFTHWIPHATVEPYVLWRVAPGDVHLSENAGLGHLDEVTGGARIAGTLPAGFDYDVEMNKQTGSLGRYTIDAWGGHWNAGYTFTQAAVRPRPFVEYNYASGNKNPNGNSWGTHDQIYPSAHDKMDFADQFGWRNIKDLRTGVSEKLGTKWELTEVFNDIWLATRKDALYNNSGSIAVAAHPGASSSHVGIELDLVAAYRQNRHVTFGFGFAHLFAGRFLQEATPGKEYNYPFAYSTYVF